MSVSNSMKVINKFNIFSEIEIQKFVLSIKLYYVTKTHLLFVTFDDCVYQYIIIEKLLKKLEFFENQVIIKFECSDNSALDSPLYMALTDNGCVYGWSDNKINGQRELKNEVSFEPKLLNSIDKFFIIDICCGVTHSLVLTYDGTVFFFELCWFDNCYQYTDFKQLIPTISLSKVTSISCGAWHSIALTENGEVFGWGLNTIGELEVEGIMKNPTQFSVPIIEKTTCGPNLSFFLTIDGDIYFCCYISDKKSYNSPEKLISTEKFIKIAATTHSEMCVALSTDNKCFIISCYGENYTQLKIRESNETSIHETFAVYEKITYKSIFVKETFKTNNYFKKYFDESRLIGCGAFSTVFECSRKNSIKLYAIKKISFDPKKEDSVLNELKILSEINGKFVVNYFSSWIEDNYYLETEYSRQNSQNEYLNNLLYNTNMPKLLHIQMELCSYTLREAIKLLEKECKTPHNSLSLIGYYISSELMYEILECVQYLHDQIPAIIHRDLKPENILITNFVNNRFVKLTDFGLSTFHDFEEQSHSKFKGTSAYQAIEVNATSKYTTKADMYSLGVILQELFHIDCIDTNAIYLPELESKMNFLIQLVQNLLSFIPNNRPTCDKVLSEFYFWILSNEQLLSDKNFKELISSTNSRSIKENFIKYFVQHKYKVHKSMYEKIQSHESKYKKNFIEVCKLGTNGFSTVFKAVNKHDKKLYAIKKVCFKPEKEELVIQELKYITSLNPTFVVTYYDSWIEPNYYIGSIHGEMNISARSILYSQHFPQLLHIQMELYSVSLRDIISIIIKECVENDNSLTIIGYYIASELLLEILDCVNYLHQNKIIHRNLKPENIFLTNFVNNRFARLSDFGLSAYIEISEQSQNMGNKTFKPPELNYTTKYSSKSDIYSLGVIIQELFHIDFNDETNENISPMNIIKNILLNTWNPLPRSRPDCEEILSEQYKWRLNIHDLEKYEDINKILRKTPQTSTIDENFIEYFIQKKLLYK